MSGNYANASARRRRARVESNVNPNNSGANYSDIREQQMSQQQMFNNGDNNRAPPPGKIHIQQAFDILIQRVNGMDSEIQTLATHNQDDYSSHITLLFEKMNSLEKSFNTLVNDNESEDNGDNHNVDKESLHNESTFNFVKKEELTKAVSNVVAKEDFNEIMTSVGKDIGHITEKTMHLNELLLQVQNGNIMLNIAISTIREEMKKRYVIDNVEISNDNETDLLIESVEETSSKLKSMNKKEIAEEVKCELTNVVVDEGSNNEEVDGISTNDETESS